MKRLAFIAAAAATLAACASPARALGPDEVTTTVILVRHAEKASEPKDDPPLTEAGAARAELLVKELRDFPLSAVLSTDFLRTRTTAEPFARQRELTIELVDARAPNHPKAVAEGILSRHRGETVLVVGHSNTVPDIIAALGAPKPRDICDNEYDNLFIVVVSEQGTPTVEARKYGAPSPDEGCRAGGTTAPPKELKD